jgi:hypothetical protein
MVSAKFFEVVFWIKAGRNRCKNEVGELRCISVNEKGPAPQRVSPEKKRLGRSLWQFSVDLYCSICLEAYMVEYKSVPMTPPAIN